MNTLYQLLARIGYSHPLHPALTHLPVGCVVAGFVFIFLAGLFRNTAYYQSARHCMGLALVALPVTALLGYYDWRHYYGGALLRPVLVKAVLAGVLFLFLIGVNMRRAKDDRPSPRLFFVHLMCLGLVVGLGYFGAELVYGARPALKHSRESAQAQNMTQGQALFEQKCSFCHYTDRTDTKLGPGLKALFRRETLPTSGWAMNEENVRRQIVSPFQTMPAFNTLSEKQIQVLIHYLKTL